MRKFTVPFLFLALLIIAFFAVSKAVLPAGYDIVVYGGGFAGCAAARNAAAAALGKGVLLIIPEPVDKPGGLGTVGGQNFADIRLWQGGLVTQGSFGRWFESGGQFYSTEGMAQIISDDLLQFDNIELLYSSDIKSAAVIDGLIRELKISPFSRNSEGRILWGLGERTIRGQVFIDASDDGRLARLAGSALSIGRQDWPKEFLPNDEQDDWSRQQAATLMFQVEGVRVPPEPMSIGDIVFTRDNKGSWGLAGGKDTWQKNPLVAAFNEKYKATGFSVKPVNAAQNGAGSDRWWVNMLLLYDVDGRAHDRDIGTLLYPADVDPNHITTDEAWIKARKILGTKEFAQVLQQFISKQGNDTYGFQEARIVQDDTGQPKVGEIIYVRESVHGQITDTKKAGGSEDQNYALTSSEVQKAGSSPKKGQDQDNYPERIGLAYYMMDINAYRHEDLKEKGLYTWPVTGALRPDWKARGAEPQNPVYLPYNVLLTKNTKNLLLPGYAACASSMAWAELRVLPNLTVLGDAAGIAASRAVLKKKNPLDFTKEDIFWIQTKLVQFGARLEK